jgi:ubiquinone/menaquinone biosynthesis C-methylase UbiE
MLTSLLDGVMERRSRQLIEQVSEWLPAEGPVLDLGSGTGHLSARLERERGIEVVTADVGDIHVTGRPPVLLIAEGALPFDDRRFTASLLFFVLAYPRDPSAVLAEAARVTRGPVILVQTLYSGRLGYAWHRVREFFWTSVAFHVSKVVGYVPSDATFTMSPRRFYSGPELRREVESAGLRIRSRRERPVLPGRALVVAGWLLEPAVTRCATRRAAAGQARLGSSSFGEVSP